MVNIADSQKINNLVRGAANILLATHQNPDADALGSLSAFCQWLEQNDKKYDAFCSNLPASNLQFLFDSEKLITDPAVLFESRYDLIVVLDSGDLKRAGLVELVDKYPDSQIINIDHHATNPNFGTVNLVDVYAASTTEILFRLFKAVNFSVSAKTASALLAGIVDDTYNFTNPNTSHDSLAIAGQLLLKGAKLSVISDSLGKNKALADLQLWGRILFRLRVNQELGIATTVVTLEDLADAPQGLEVTEGIANFLNNLSGVSATLILRQEDAETIKGSFRTNSDLIDVAKLATILGGGGHRKAAGFKLKGKLVSTPTGGWQVI